MTDVPLHLQAIAFLQRRISKRRDELRAKAGNGLEDQAYQRTVGAIRECTTQLADLEELRKSILEDIEQEESDGDEFTADRREPPPRSPASGRSGNTPSRRARRNGAG